MEDFNKVENGAQEKSIEVADSHNQARKQKGVTLIEYALIAAAVALVALGGMKLLGNTLNNSFNNIANNVSAK